MKAWFICCCCNIMACIVSCCFSCSFRLMSNSCWRSSLSALAFSRKKSTSGCAHLLRPEVVGWSSSVVPLDNFRFFVSPMLSMAFFLTSSALSLSCWTDRRLSSGLMVSSLSINSSIRTSFSVRSSTTTPLAASSSWIFYLNFRRSNTQRSLTPLLSLMRNCGESIWLSFSAIESHESPRPTLPFLKENTSFPSASKRRAHRSTP